MPTDSRIAMLQRLLLGGAMKADPDKDNDSAANDPDKDETASVGKQEGTERGQHAVATMRFLFSQPSEVLGDLGPSGQPPESATPTEKVRAANMNRVFDYADYLDNGKMSRDINLPKDEPRISSDAEGVRRQRAKK